MKLKVLNPTQFEAKVFGGWCFLKNFPEIVTTGVEVLLHTNGNYYMVKDGKPVDGVHSFAASTCFFSPEEVAFDCVALEE